MVYKRVIVLFLLAVSSLAVTLYADNSAAEDRSVAVEAVADGAVEAMHSGDLQLALPDSVVNDDAGMSLIPIERDPFWPVGFDPTPPPPPEVEEVEEGGVTSKPKEPPKPKLPEPGRDDWAVARAKLKPNAGSSVNPDGSKTYFALMHNRLLSQGQKVEARTDLFHFTWRVAGIGADGVKFTPLTARRLSDGTEFTPDGRKLNRDD